MATIKGGDRLELALARIAKSVSKPATLKVGFLEGATAPDGQSIPLRAALNEYGHEHNGVVTPSRPFFRNMVSEKSPEWPKAVGDLLTANDYDAVKTLRLTGEAIKGQLQQSIVDLTSPPLAESTIEKKDFDKPLIEHGDLLNAADYEVKT